MKKKEKVTKKAIPHFNSEEEERDFWSVHDSTEFINWPDAQKTAFPNLKPSTEAISLRLPVSMLNNLKVLANRKDVPYQSLIKIFLEEKIRQEFDSSASS